MIHRQHNIHRNKCLLQLEGAADLPLVDVVGQDFLKITQSEIPNTIESQLPRLPSILQNNVELKKT